MAVEIVYETHSISDHNEAGIASGWLPGELSALGRELAAELGTRRRDDGLAAVFSSDLRRAVQTAEIAFAGSAVPLLRDRRLRECHYGDLDGMPVSMRKGVEAGTSMTRGRAGRATGRWLSRHGTSWPIWPPSGTAGRSC